MIGDFKMAGTYKYRAGLLVLVLGAWMNMGLWARAQSPNPNKEQAAGEAWELISIPDGQVSVRMPGQPKFMERKMNPVESTITTVHQYILAVDPYHNYVFAYHDLPRAPDSLQKLDETLDGGVKGALARTLGDMKNIKKIKLGNYHGREFVYECVLGEDPDQSVKLKLGSRLFVINQRLYQLTYIAKPESYSDKDAKKFLESFNYQPAAAQGSTGDASPEKNK